MTQPALKFREPTLNDGEYVRETLFHVEQSDLAFANIYLLRRKYGTSIALHENVLYRHFSGDGRLRGYAFPVGNQFDVSQALFHVEQHAKYNGNPLQFTLLTEDNARVLRDFYGEKVNFSDDPGNADYLYLRDDLVELAGTAFHKKRNQIARFERMYPDWYIEPLMTSNVADALSIARAWVSSQQASANHEHELRAIEHAIRDRIPLDITGWLLYVNDEPASLSLSSYINCEVVDIHYEKCVPKYRDAYPIIIREVARYMCCKYINREEDLNIPGLRQAKLSWKPHHILHKLTANVTLC